VIVSKIDYCCSVLASVAGLLLHGEAAIGVQHHLTCLLIVVIIIHEFHSDTSLKQNFRAAGRQPSQEGVLSTSLQ